MKDEEASYAEAMKRQLQTVQFTVGFKVFKARRKLRKAFNREKQ